MHAASRLRARARELAQARPDCQSAALFVRPFYQALRRPCERLQSERRHVRGRRPNAAAGGGVAAIFLSAAAEALDFDF